MVQCLNRVSHRNFKMSVNLNSVCTTDEELEIILEGVIKEEGFKNYKIEDAIGAVKGDGYIGIITNVKITGNTSTNNNKVLHLVVKRASKSDALRNELPVAAAFQRELYMYSTIFPMFRNFEIQKNVPPSSFIPKFYEGNVIHKHETVILENLKENDYRLYERRLPMDDKHVRLVITEYGRLHALSFALRDQHPQQFETVIRSMNNLAVSLFKDNFLNSLIHRCSKILETMASDTDKVVKKTFAAFAGEIETYLEDLCQCIDDYSVVLHGDCWTNNIMFKYEDINKPTIPSKVCFIDFQLSSIGSPILDLAGFFYCCSSKEIISNLNYYMELYYNSLSTYMHKLGSNPSEIYPYEILRKQWTTYAKYGLLIAVINIHVMLTEEDEAVDLKDSAESGGVASAFNYEICHVDEYNDRIKHIILHFIENKFIS